MKLFLGTFLVSPPTGHWKRLWENQLKNFAKNDKAFLTIVSPRRQYQVFKKVRIPEAYVDLPNIDQIMSLKNATWTSH